MAPTMPPLKKVKLEDGVQRDDGDVGCVVAHTADGGATHGGGVGDGGGVGGAVTSAAASSASAPTGASVSTDGSDGGGKFNLIPSWVAEVDTIKPTDDADHDAERVQSILVANGEIGGFEPVAGEERSAESGEPSTEEERELKRLIAAKCHAITKLLENGIAKS